MDDRLRNLRLFAHLDEADLVRICEGVDSRRLYAGAYLFREGDPGDAAYVITEGAVEVIKAVGRRETLLAVRGPGDVIGEMALLQDEPRIASVRARAPTEVLVIPRGVLEAVLAASPAATRAMFGTLLERLDETNQRQRQTDRMAQLGTLTAGIAHELNNPAAGAHQAAAQLSGALDALAETIGRNAPLEEHVRARIVERLASAAPVVVDGLARADAETAVEDWLDERGVDGSWRLAPDIVTSGLGTADLEDLTAGLDARATAAAVGLLVGLALPRRLARDVAEAARRISEIVGRLKTHAHLDRAPVAEVDVHDGLDDSVALLSHKLQGVTVIRDYGDDVPAIVAAPAELNQVWTNLLDNAAYELQRAGTERPAVTVRTRAAEGEVIVEVEDNGPGIPPDVRDRVFDAFFTTKPPGSGTGQGLNISYQIVVLDHGGEMTVDSVPGRTTLRVALPVGGAQRVGR